MAITISGTTLTYNDGSTDTTDTENTTAALSAGAIGSYAQLMFPGNTVFRTPGFTVAGSSLRYAAATGQTGTPTAPTTPGGSWRLMGELPSVYVPAQPVPKGVIPASTTYTTVSVWLRYA